MLVFSDFDTNTEKDWQQLGAWNLAEMLIVVHPNVPYTLTQIAL